MKFSLFNGKNNNLKITRENFVKEFKVNEIEITPCEKFVACLEKLSKNYVLALRDTATAETLQIANQNDLEFFEGYELSPNYTDSVRLNLSKKIRNAYLTFIQIQNVMNNVENKLHYDKKPIFSDIKLDLRALSNVLLNIYQNLTLTNNAPQLQQDFNIPNDLKEALEYLKELLLSAIKELLEALGTTIIEYITRQLNLIINKLLMYVNYL